MLPPGVLLRFLVPCGRPWGYAFFFFPLLLQQNGADLGNHGKFVLWGGVCFFFFPLATTAKTMKKHTL